jgi:AcrR family transcriptional regulator
MAEVAVAAGVSQGLAYRYFANKDELFRALVAKAGHRRPEPMNPHAIEVAQFGATL